MRVIAGRLGGRRLVAPRGLATRPTTDRVREALFSALGSVHGARVLDLYAGTGALGIEAFSRGASSVVFVESARPALAALRRNLGALELGPDVVRVVPSPVGRALAEIVRGGPWDLVLVDPPYAVVERALAELAGPLRTSMPEGARLVLEHASRGAPPILSGFEPQPPRVYGDTAVTLYGRIAEGGP